MEMSLFFRNRDDVLKEQIARYRAIFGQAEDKIQMLSNALRQYLNQRENLPDTTVSENHYANDQEVPNNNSTHVLTATGCAPLTSRNSTSNRRGRGGSSKSRGTTRSSSRTVVNEDQLAITNASDIELLSCIFFISRFYL